MKHDPEMIERVARVVDECSLMDWESCVKIAQAALDAAFQWRDIETAPKDGRTILVLSQKGICRCSWDAVDWGDHPLDKVHRWWSNPDDAFWFEEPGDDPTHWLPLPPAPEED